MPAPCFMAYRDESSFATRCQGLKNGDFLRGRVLEMDETRLKVEVRLETRDVPRDRVAQIIWLHPDELTGKAAPTAAASPRSTRVQTVRADGNRLTFVADRADDKTISG